MYESIVIAYPPVIQPGYQTQIRLHGIEFSIMISKAEECSSSDYLYENQAAAQASWEKGDWFYSKVAVYAKFNGSLLQNGLPIETLSGIEVNLDSKKALLQATVQAMMQTAVPKALFLAKERVHADCANISSGVLARLSGLTRYADIEKLQAEFVSFVEQSNWFYSCWQMAWTDFKASSLDMVSSPETNCTK